MARGFITPVSLHYVRNHGPVPKMPWDTHKLNIGDSFPPLPCLTCTLHGLIVFPTPGWSPSDMQWRRKRNRHALMR